MALDFSVSTLRFLNLGSFAASLLFVYGAGSGWFGKPFNQVSNDFTVLASPTSATYSFMWALIHIGLSVFTLASFSTRWIAPQILTSYVGLHFAAMNLWTVLWGIAYSREGLIVSQIFALLAWAHAGRVACLMHRERDHFHKNSTSQPFSLLSMGLTAGPFSLAYSWLTLGALTQLNQIVYAHNKSNSSHSIAMSMVAIAFAFSFSLGHSLFARHALPHFAFAATAYFFGITRRADIASWAHKYYGTRNVDAVHHTALFGGFFSLFLFALGVSRVIYGYNNVEKIVADDFNLTGGNSAPIHDENLRADSAQAAVPSAVAMA